MSFHLMPYADLDLSVKDKYRSNAMERLRRPLHAIMAATPIPSLRTPRA